MASKASSRKKAEVKKTAGKRAAATKRRRAATSSARQTSNKGMPRRKPPVADAVVDLPEVGRVLVFQAKAANVVKQLGGPTSVARVLKVAKSQPGRWVRGAEAPSPTSTKHLLDLDYVLSRLEQLYEPATALSWLTSPNAYLDGARPLEVLLAQGPTDVIKAIDASVAGSYA